MPVAARALSPAILASLALLAGPVAAEPQPGGAEVLDACALVKPEEISAVLALQVRPGLRRDAGTTRDGAYSSTCLWVVPLAEGVESDPRLPLGGASFAILNVQTWPDGPAGARRYLEDFRSSAEAHLIDRTPIEVKAGDEGLWWGNGVAVRKGGVSFGISVHLGARDQRAMEETLARTIAGRL